MLRGPDTGEPASYGLKLHYAQQAGALAVIFVNSDPHAELFDMLPQIKEGKITFGVKAEPEDTNIVAGIPSIFVTNKCLHGLGEREDNMTGIVYAPEETDEDSATYAWQKGMVVLSAQVGTGGMAKREADDLMAKFLADRKQERLQESQMLADVKSKEVDQAEEVLKTREFYGGNFLESMNPFKQNQDTEDIDNKVQSRVVHTFLQKAQIPYLQAKMKALQVQIKLCPAPNLRYTMGRVRV